MTSMLALLLGPQLPGLMPHPSLRLLLSRHLACKRMQVGTGECQADWLLGLHQGAVLTLCSGCVFGAVFVPQSRHLTSVVPM